MNGLGDVEGRSVREVHVGKTMMIVSVFAAKAPLLPTLKFMLYPAEVSTVEGDGITFAIVSVELF